MKIGKTERETLELNGWGIGDILEGGKPGQTAQIVITAIGEETFLCRWKYPRQKDFGEEGGNSTLNHRIWKKVGRVGAPG